MTVGICMARNEAGIIGRTVRHLYAQGVDRVVVEDGQSTDQTAQAAEAAGALVLHADSREYRQSERMSELAKIARPGEWVIPFDADEFWYSDHGTLAEALERVDADKCYARMYLHRNMQERRPDAKPLPKVAFRMFDGAVISDGNHDVNLPGGAWGVVDIREWQYRSFDHLVEKVEKTRELRAHTPGLPETFGAHMLRLARMTPDELAAEWEAMQQGEWIVDPVPGHG